MRSKIKLNEQFGRSVAEVFDDFVFAQTAEGLSEVTIRNYKLHLHSISKHLDIQQPMKELTNRQLEEMIVSMRKSGLAHNSISAYARVFRTFLNWCQRQGVASLTMPHITDKETVKETYTDEELALLLQKPKSDCSFAEYRNWVIVNFLLNSGCRAATVRNIQIRDVDLAARQIIYRHTKNGKIQTVPLCSKMASILKDYMAIRKGQPAEYLFCDQYGDMLSENGLRLAIAHYNRSRGVEKTSIHLFRHTFARKYLVDCGGDAFMLQRLLGHSTLKMTKHYCAIYDADIAKNFDRFSPLAQINTTKGKLKRA